MLRYFAGIGSAPPIGIISGYPMIGPLWLNVKVLKPLLLKIKPETSYAHVVKGGAGETEPCCPLDFM